jgi:hypothetical protein
MRNQIRGALASPSGGIAAGELMSPDLGGPAQHRRPRSDLQPDPAVQTGDKHTALMAAVAAVDVRSVLLEREPMYIGIGALLLIIILVVILL